ncbi:sigma-70 family RNA polymerase sigma factor [Clostridium sp.]|jgi:RNA polymerase sigma factor (sigma-70 family)|uniref:sigma-70 family RNA polymerase sigma factor n=1 Tax=Clostridium sp. TaxID=1506 RepID=UPI003A42A7EC
MEDKKLIKLSNGKTKEMTCSEVYEQFKNFLYKTAFKWSHQYSVDDVFQVAGIGLTKAYNSYDVDKDILFMTYLATIVNNEIRMYHYKNEKHVGVKSLDSPIGEHPTLLIDMLADNTDYEEIAVENINKVWINNLCKKLIEHLNSREKKIIKYRFMGGLTLRKIGEKVGISGSRIGQIIDSCIAKMKIYYESEEFNVNVNSRKECFKYFSENDTKEKSELISDVVKKYGCTPGTAENYYYTWKSQYLKSEDMSEVKPKGEIKVKDLIREPQMVKKSTYEKVKEFKPKNGVLQATNLRGKIMCYNLYDNGNGFYMKRPNGNTVMPIEFAEVDDLIKELQAVKRAGE